MYRRREILHFDTYGDGPKCVKSGQKYEKEKELPSIACLVLEPQTVSRVMALQLKHDVSSTTMQQQKKTTPFLAFRLEEARSAAPPKKLLIEDGQESTTTCQAWITSVKNGVWFDVPAIYSRTHQSRVTYQHVTGVALDPIH
jgi:hypothetical protein